MPARVATVLIDLAVAWQPGLLARRSAEQFAVCWDYRPSSRREEKRATRMGI